MNLIAPSSTRDRLIAPTPRQSVPQPRRACGRKGIGGFLFLCGDAVFLAAVGAESGAVMQWLHGLEWNFWVASVIGMAVAMGVQMLLGFGLSPLLGSIETMAPSMVVAMAVPMLLDVAEITAWMIRRTDAALLGATFALLYFLYLQWYGAAFQHRLALIWSTGAKPQ